MRGWQLIDPMLGLKPQWNQNQEDPAASTVLGRVHSPRFAPVRHHARLPPPSPLLTPLSHYPDHRVTRSTGQ